MLWSGRISTDKSWFVNCIFSDRHTAACSPFRTGIKGPIPDLKLLAIAAKLGGRVYYSWIFEWILHTTATLWFEYRIEVIVKSVNRLLELPLYSFWWLSLRFLNSVSGHREMYVRQDSYKKENVLLVFTI